MRAVITMPESPFGRRADLYYAVLATIILLLIAVLCASCAGTAPGSTNPLINVLTKINNAGLADLKRVEAVAGVPNANLPGGIEDKDGLQCAQAGEAVLTQINAVNAAANGPGAGALTLAEMASLFQPGSPQFNQAQNTLAAGCVAKANDVMGPAGVVAAGGVVGAIAANQSILPLLAAAPK